MRSRSKVPAVRRPFPGSGSGSCRASRAAVAAASLVVLLVGTVLPSFAARVGEGGKHPVADPARLLPADAGPGSPSFLFVKKRPGLLPTIHEPAPLRFRPDASFTGSHSGWFLAGAPDVAGYSIAEVRFRPSSVAPFSFSQQTVAQVPEPGAGLLFSVGFLLLLLVAGRRFLRKLGHSRPTAAASGSRRRMN